MTDRITSSPLATYQAHLASGELAYQFDPVASQAVFFPRLLAPGSGRKSLVWRVSEGLGTVYATTTVFRRGEAPYNVVLIDLDEGFRLMSRVQGKPEDVRIGQRVRARVHRPVGDDPPYPVFDVVE